MPDQTYTSLNSGSIDEAFKNRVKIGILHTAVNVKIKAAPTASEGPADALGRSVVADPELWKNRFSPVVAVLLIGQPSLTETDISDSELFSAIDAAWPKFFEQPDLA